MSPHLITHQGLAEDFYFTWGACFFRARIAQKFSKVNFLAPCPFLNYTGIYFASYKKTAVGGALRLGATFGALRVRVIAPLKATPLRIILTQT